jgi:hypothetical protein
MDWSSLLTLAVIGLMIFLMMRHGGGCCGGTHSHLRYNRKEAKRTGEAQPPKDDRLQ